MKTNPLTFFSMNENRFGGPTAHMFERRGWLKVFDPVEATVIVFNGGADIGTSIYGEQPVFDGIPRAMSKRDIEEVTLYERFRHDPRLKFGICRGAQLINCLNGGTLWQHVDGHQQDHMMTVCETGARLYVTSTHHQMMRPTEKAKIIGVADEATYKMSQNDEYTKFGAAHYRDDGKDAEIVYYGDTNSLCIQGHPEYVPSSKFTDFSFELIAEYVAAGAARLRA